MALGKRIKDLLEEKNIKVSTLSQETGISPQTLYAILRRDNDAIKPESLQKICKALNVSSAYLMGFNEIEEEYSDFSSYLTEEEKLLCLYLKKMNISISVINKDELYSISSDSFPSYGVYLTYEEFQDLKLKIANIIQYTIDMLIKTKIPDYGSNKAPTN